MYPDKNVMWQSDKEATLRVTMTLRSEGHGGDHKRPVFAQAPDLLRDYVTENKMFRTEKFRFRKLLVSDRNRNSHPSQQPLGFSWLLHGTWDSFRA